MIWWLTTNLTPAAQNPALERCPACRKTTCSWRNMPRLQHGPTFFKALKSQQAGLGGLSGSNPLSSGVSFMKGFITQWPVLEQIRTGKWRGTGEEAMSGRTRNLTPKIQDADVSR